MGKRDRARANATMPGKIKTAVKSGRYSRACCSRNPGREAREKYSNFIAVSIKLLKAFNENRIEGAAVS
jgi:hypothetical protein